MSYLKETFGLQGKRALVTGASRGIGQAIAIALANAGADVAITASKSEDALAETKHKILEAGRKCVPLVYNVGSTDHAVKGVDDAAEALGGLDIVVNNAGQGWPEDVLTMTPESLSSCLNINLSGAYFTAQRAAQLMVEQGSGCIVNISSAAGSRALAAAPQYSISKAAVDMSTKSMATQLASKGVRVNSIAPGWIESDMTKPLREDAEWVRKACAAIPLKRLGMPDEIAGVVVFLASGAASFIHGETVVVDGGMIITVPC